MPHLKPLHAVISPRAIHDSHGVLLCTVLDKLLFLRRRPVGQYPDTESGLLWAWTSQ